MVMLRYVLCYLKRKLISTKRDDFRMLLSHALSNSYADVYPVILEILTILMRKAKRTRKKLFQVARNDYADVCTLLNENNTTVNKR